MVNVDGDVVAVILARGGSKGIPGKNIKVFHGRPLLSWTVIQLQSAGIENIVVSTDDDSIARTAIGAGATVVDRPEALATDTASGDEAVIHALDCLDIADDTIVVIAQVTSPLRNVEHIQATIELVRSRQADSAFSGVQIDDICVWSIGDSPTPITYDHTKRLMRQQRDPLIVENGSLYCTRAGSMRRSGNRLSGNLAVAPMPKWSIHEIDDPGDFELCEALMAIYVEPRRDPGE